MRGLVLLLSACVARGGALAPPPPGASDGLVTSCIETLECNPGGDGDLVVPAMLLLAIVTVPLLVYATQDEDEGRTTGGAQPGP